MTTAEHPRATARAAPATLIERLAGALESAGIAYCQWKGHSKRHRWLTGTGDLDLLVDRTAWSALVDVLLQLGFKRAVAPGWLQLPGVDSYVGYEPATGRLVHVHAYHQIVVGLPWRTTYTVPLAATVLASAIGLPPPLEGKGLVTGGRVLALVGGDGAGKTTCATELTAWLGAEFATLRVHLGRPARSLATLAVGCALRVARWLHTGLAGQPELLRCVCTARARARPDR